MTLYWVSAIVVRGNKPRLLAFSDAELSLKKAMDGISFIKENNTVLSVWVDAIDENNVKSTVFHECYINAFGDIFKSK